MENKPQNDDIVIKDEKDIDHVKEVIKEEVIKENTPNKEQNELYLKALEEASMPVKMNDTDFKLGANELDIRFLSKSNKEQMMFRQGVLTIIYAKQCLTSLIDITRLLMVIADKMGVPDIIKATDDIIEKTSNQRKELENFLPKEDKDA